MEGIYLINEKIHINGLSQKESMTIQKQALDSYIHATSFEPVKLNTYQLHTYYTIPHALLFDLKKHRIQFACLLMYSNESIEDFFRTYPAKWLILKSYFDQVLTLI